MLSVLLFPEDLMRAMLTSLFVVLMPVLCLAEPPAEELEQVVKENMRATQAEETDAIMKTMHSESPGRAATKAQLPALFERFDLEYTLLKCEFVSISGDYAIMRVEQRTTKVDGAAFRDNIVDSLMIFKQDKGRWKIWTQTVLEISFE